MTGGAVLLEQGLAAAAVALEVERRSVGNHHLLAVGRHLPGEDFQGALAHALLAVLAKLLDASRLELSGEDNPLLDGVEQRVEPISPCEQGFEALTPHRRTVSRPR